MVGELEALSVSTSSEPAWNGRNGPRKRGKGVCACSPRAAPDAHSRSGNPCSKRHLLPVRWYDVETDREAPPMLDDRSTGSEKPVLGMRTEVMRTVRRAGTSGVR